MRKQIEHWKKTSELWVSVRQELELRGKKLGMCRPTYYDCFLMEEFEDEEIKVAMRNFLTDPWWSNEGKGYQDLEHFIRNYTRFMPDAYDAKKPSMERLGLIDIE